MPRGVPHDPPGPASVTNDTQRRSGRRLNTHTHPQAERYSAHRATAFRRRTGADVCGADEAPPFCVECRSFAAAYGLRSGLRSPWDCRSAPSWSTTSLNVNARCHRVRPQPLVASVQSVRCPGRIYRTHLAVRITGALVPLSVRMPACPSIPGAFSGGVRCALLGAPGVDGHLGLRTPTPVIITIDADDVMAIWLLAR